MPVLHGCRINDNGGPDVPALPGVFSAGHNHDVPVPVHRGKKGFNALFHLAAGTLLRPAQGIFRGHCLWREA